ncbi:hypothetical protein PS376_03265 [Limosilactobacillus pontis]|uniref:hypothetical protein n=1 Tax=Limosilactobacillus pontis TaxID=35787 RepID=UPI002F268CA8
MLELRDFKRIFSIATAILTIINIFKISSISSIDLTILMFLLSNMLAITGLTLRKKWEKGVVRKIRLLSEYAIWIIAVIVLFDDSNSIISANVTLLTLRRIYTVVVIYTCTYCVCITAFAITQAELEKSIREVSKAVVKKIADDEKKNSRKPS